MRFCNSGTEANLLALATARAVTGKDAIMIFNGAYHGSLFYFSHGAIAAQHADAGGDLDLQ